jgi:hypothetical protein
MITVPVQVPKDLGLTDDQVSTLRDKFESHLVDNIQAQGRDVSVEAKAKAEVVHVEVIAI